MLSSSDLDGHRFGRLVVIGFEEVRGKNSVWRCVCDCGAEKLVRRDHLTGARVQSCGCFNSDSVRERQTGRLGWTKDQPSYEGAHMRVRLRRGSASAYMCECGVQADEWAYDHADPGEFYAPPLGDHYDGSLFYSGDPDHYVPMCRECHRALDRAFRDKHLVAG